MYRSEVSGCLISFLIFLLFMLLLKEFWWVIVGILLILIVIYYANKIYKMLKTKNASYSDSNYTPQMGEVYKVCPYCNTKVKVTEVTCPCCKHSLN